MRYASYKIYRDINPNSPTYNQTKKVRNEVGDDECTLKYSSKWVLSRRSCSDSPDKIIEVTDYSKNSYDVEEYRDENPNSPTYNEYQYKQVGICQASVDKTPNWILVSELSGISNSKTEYVNPISGNKWYNIETYRDVNTNSDTYNQTKVVFKNEVNNYVFESNTNVLNTSNIETTNHISITSTYNNSDIDWSIVNNNDWIIVNKISNQLQITTKQNILDTQRNGKIKLIQSISQKELIIDVIQLNGVSIFEVDNTNLDIAYNDTLEKQINVTSTINNKNTNWNINNQSLIPTWLTVQKSDNQLIIKTTQNI